MSEANSELLEAYKELADFLDGLRYFYYENEYNSGYVCPSCGDEGEHELGCELLAKVNKARAVIAKATPSQSQAQSGPEEAL